MKKFFALGLILVLALSMLTACSGNGGNGGNGGKSSAPSGGNTNTSAPPASDSGSSSAPVATTDNEKKGGIITPEITVNPGDVIFDNEYLNLVYEGVEIFGNSLIICCSAATDSDKIMIIDAAAEPLVINGKTVNYTDKVGAQTVPETKGSHYPDRWRVTVSITKSAMEEAKITLEDIKTVQATFSAKHRSNMTENIFQGAALFNIELP